MSYTVMNRIQVDAGEAGRFEEVFAASMRSTLNGVPGLIRANLLRPASAGRPYVSVMEFTTPDAFRAWMKSDSFAAAHSGASQEAAVGDSAIEVFDTVIDMQF